jgi:hypothetical protein
MRASVWKATTAAALGLALVFAIRPMRGHDGSAPPPAVTTDTARTEAPPATSQGPGSPGVSRSAALVAKLHGARSTAAACAALDGLGRIGDAAAQAALVDAFQTRAHAEVR